VTFEWALIAGQNDTPEVAHELGALLRGLMCHINLIPLNPTKGYDGARPSLAWSARACCRLLEPCERRGRRLVGATLHTRAERAAGAGRLQANRRRPRRFRRSLRS